MFLLILFLNDWSLLRDLLYHFSPKMSKTGETERYDALFVLCDWCRGDIINNGLCLHGITICFISDASHLQIGQTTFCNVFWPDVM